MVRNAMPGRDYPETVIEVIDDEMLFRVSALRAVRRFAASHPWRGSPTDRKEKFRGLNQSLAVAYGIPEPELEFGEINGSSSGSSHYIPALHRIVLVGKLSVITFLHEFAHARGMDERGACRWSISLFRRIFSKQYARLIHRRHMLIAPRELTAEPAGGRF